MKTIVNLSGGKDSTAMLHVMIEKGIHFDEVIFSDTTVEFPQMYEHLDLIEQKTGIKITRIEPEHDFYYYLTQIERKNIRSKIREHLKGYGFAGVKSRWCTHQFKIANPRKYLREKYGGEPVMHCIGIAADEKHRVKDDLMIRYPLIEYGITEEKALNLCKSLGYNWGGVV